MQKKVKVFYGNQHVRNINLNKISFMDRIKMLLKVSAKTAAIAMLVYGSFKAGQQLFPVKVYAEKTVEVQVPVDLDIPILNKIISCESGGNQYGKDGQINVNINVRADGTKSIDVGVGQINSAWFSTATKMGYDLTKEKDNLAFARWLFLNKGSSPWYSSQNCWSK